MSRMRYGENPILEAEADRLLRESMAGVHSHEAKRDILTDWKKRDRYSREVYAEGGTVDPAIRRGMYHRAANERLTHLNSTEGVGGSPSARRRHTTGGYRSEEDVSPVERFIEGVQ